MSAKVDISVVGVKDTINKLRKLDPELQKQFKVDATAIAQPALNAAKAVYTQVPLSVVIVINEPARFCMNLYVSGLDTIKNTSAEINEYLAFSKIVLILWIVFIFYGAGDDARPKGLEAAPVAPAPAPAPVTSSCKSFNKYSIWFHINSVSFIFSVC